MKFLKNEIKDYVILLRNTPPIFTSLFFLTVVVMNLLANKELFRNEFVAIDCGTLISWFTFLAMDMFCRHFGPKASMKLSIFSVILNLLFSFIFYVVSLSPGHWGQYYSSSEMAIVDTVLNNTICSSWYVVVGSAIAMLAASCVNSGVNYLVSLFMESKSFKSFAFRSYFSTIAGQFTDNMLFAIIVCHVFFGWSWRQIILCASLTTVFELVGEILFSPIGYKLCVLWEKHGIGKDYLIYAEKKRNR